MKKKEMTATLLIFATLFGLFAILPGTALAADPIKVFVNGKAVVFPDEQPYIDDNGRTVVPVRFVTEALGCKVEWRAATQTVTIDRGKIHVELTIGKKEITVLGVRKTMDTSAVLKAGRTFVPIRFVSEAFGCKVGWETKTRTVTIDDPGKDVYMVGSFSLAIEDGDNLSRGTDGGLTVIKKSGLILGDEKGIGGKAVLTIQIKVDIPSTDIPKQRQETESLLKQCLSAKVADEIMAYVAGKQVFSTLLATKDWKEGKYSITAGGGIGPIAISIYMD